MGTISILILSTLLVYNSSSFSLQSLRSVRSSNNNNYGNASSENNLNASEKSFSSVCGEVFTKQQFVLESKNYPANYENDQDCSYLIKGPHCPTDFTFEFLNFNLESSPGCVNDRLEIENQDALCGVQKSIKKYHAKNGALQLRFVSNNQTTSRGFRIIVTRSPCEGLNETLTTSTGRYNLYTTKKDSEWTTTTIKPRNSVPYPSETHNTCCNAKYNSRRILITSPNFPQSSSTPIDCVYPIYKTHPNVCRLRIHALFFWLDFPNSPQCSNYLQIDGKYICGCKSELKLISTFDVFGQPKLLRFKSSGNVKNSYSGFILEIIQDECPIRLDAPAGLNLKLYNDQLNRVVWPNYTQESLVEKLKLINENTEIIEDENNIQTIINHYYYYTVPEFTIPVIPREREDTTYVEISSVNSVLPDLHDYAYCSNWNEFQFNNLYGNGRTNLPVCKSQTLPDTGGRGCQEFNYLKGYIKSPGYPDCYPSNLNLCYRFKKQRGYCTIKINMQEFQIENSEACQKDYLLFGNRYRYCGNRLQSTTSTLDLRGREYEDVYFVTDNYKCGRGFTGVYEQIPCQETPYPINPSPPTGSCDRVIKDRKFNIDIYDYHSPSCRFKIRRYDPDVCVIKLYLDYFDLICSSEFLQIGDRMLCGRLTGQTVTLELGYRVPEVVYKKMPHPGIRGKRISIRGVQSVRGCEEERDVPAQRNVLLKSGNVTDDVQDWKISFSNDTIPVEDVKYFITLTQKFRDVCGIVNRESLEPLPENFCELTKETNDVSKCIQFKSSDISSVIMKDPLKIELKAKLLSNLNDIEFREVDCDILFSLLIRRQ